MKENKKEKLDEEKLNQNHDLWRNHKITDSQYFSEINRIRSKIY